MLLEECEEDSLDKKEIEYIRRFDSTDGDKGYNNESGGNKNKRMSEEARRKMSLAKQGMYIGKDNPMYGVH